MTAGGRAGPEPEPGLLVVVPEVTGVTPSVRRFAARLALPGQQVQVLHLLDEPPVPQRCERDAYAAFVAGTGVDGLSERLAERLVRLRGSHPRIDVVGLSVGASAAWRVAGPGLADRVVCLYGSRIRDAQDVRPTVPVLALFAAREASFDPAPLAGRLAVLSGVQAHVLPFGHGFCNDEHPEFDAVGRDEVVRRIRRWWDCGWSVRT